MTAALPRISNFIAGANTAPGTGAYIDNVDPATGQVYSHLPDSSKEDVNRAVAAAEQAFPTWSRTPAPERSRFLLRIADLIERDLEKLARAESIDTGKPFALAKSVDIPRAASNFRFFAGAILHAHTEAVSTESRDARALNFTLRQPRGVVGAISPWNLPLYLFTWKIAPALATGNTIVGKPSELTPMTASMLGGLCQEAGLPGGVLNIVHGYGATVGAAIVRHPGINTITFTGGTATGRDIAAAAAPMFKKVALELGGKNPNIVFADADFELAVEGSVRAAFTNQGQICLSGSRIYVERSLHDRFLNALIERTRGLRVGDPLDLGTHHGAMISHEHFEKVMNAIEQAKQDGGEIVCGGGPPSHEMLTPRCRKGCFIRPTIITKLPRESSVNREEIFGPVVTVTPFDEEREVLEWANDTPYGLAATVWTQNLTRSHRFAEQLQAGVIWINCWLVRDLRTPFGGMKQSGLGREGGDEALRFFTEPKNVCVRLA